MLRSGRKPGQVGAPSVCSTVTRLATIGSWGTSTATEADGLGAQARYGASSTSWRRAFRSCPRSRSLRSRGGLNTDVPLGMRRTPRLLGSTATRTRGRRGETTTGKRFVGAAAVAVVVTVGVSLGVTPARAQAGPIRVVVRQATPAWRPLTSTRDGWIDMGDPVTGRAPVVDARPASPSVVPSPIASR